MALQSSTNLRSALSSPRSSTSSIVSPASLGDGSATTYSGIASPPLVSPNDGVDVDEPAGFKGYAFSKGSTSIPIPSPSPNDLLQSLQAFTFGTCPSGPAPTHFIGTPTAELGQFEYPQFEGAPSPSPPPTRRSSTCSTLLTMPIAGRRPSVLHSSTAPPDTLPVVPDDYSASSFSRPSSRRPSILFQSRNPPVPSPIPPSLLKNRRGSLPVSTLFPQHRHSLTLSESSSSHTINAQSTRRGSLAPTSPPDPSQSYFTIRRQSVPHYTHPSLLNPPRRSNPSPRASMSLNERRVFRSSTGSMSGTSANTNSFLSSGSEDDSVEEENESPIQVERPLLETIGSDETTPTGSAESTITVSALPDATPEVQAALAAIPTADVDDPGADGVEGADVLSDVAEEPV